MDHRRPDIQGTLAECDWASSMARKSIVLSEFLLARVREVAHSMDERIRRALDDGDSRPE